MKEILIKTAPEVLEHMRTAVSTESPEDITLRLTNLKPAVQEAGVEVSFRKYVVGIELSQGAFTKLQEAHAGILEKYPPESVPYPKITLKDDGTVEKTTIYRYVNTCPIGKAEVPMEDVTDEQALFEFAKLEEADITAIADAKAAIDKADTAKDLREALTAFEVLKCKLLKQYRIPTHLYVTRSTMNEALVAKAQLKLDEAIGTQKFLQFKVAALKNILAEKVAARHNKAAVETAANWMTPEGVAKVEEVLGE